MKTYSPRSWNNCFGTFKSQNGDVYVGDFKNGQYHGNGTYTFSPNGSFPGRFILVNGCMAREMEQV